MIIEGILTTTSADGSPHHAPMGPLVDDCLQEWLLRPFQTSTTFLNLRRHRQCVFHVVDDVLLLVHSALGIPIELSYQRSQVGGWVIDSACHWYCLETVDWELDQPRSQVTARVLEQGALRPFWGWNRAKHAIIEATILATRFHLTGRQTVLEELDRLASTVHKTAGPRELAAWELIRGFMAQADSDGSQSKG